jgi:hypothetical protein
MDKDQLNKSRVDRMRIARARLGLGNEASEKAREKLTPLQADLEFFLLHHVPTNERPN